jgi:catechol 2,3-dioxygenase-like lactoylglutathione lyase family enzyme
MVPTEDPPPLRGIHHLKFAVSDLDESLHFYERALGARRLPEADHVRHDGTYYAYVVEVPGLGTMIELRLDPERAARQALFDPLTIALDDRAALEIWDAALTERGVLHSPILVALQAWLIVVQDPDGNRLRLYTLETHGPEVAAATDSPWLDGGRSTGHTLRSREAQPVEARRDGRGPAPG